MDSGLQVRLPKSASRSQPFVPALESVRGLAALSVALFHSFHLWSIGGERVFTKTVWQIHSIDVALMRLITMFFNGAAAVSLFFVLSGFVLMLSLRTDERRLGAVAKSFGLRRMLRIYPPLALNIVLFAGALTLLHSAAPAAFGAVTTSQLFSSLMLVDFAINGATWTLRVELAAISFIFLGFLLLLRFAIPGLLALLLFAIITLFTPQLLFRLLEANYLFMFVIGMVVAEGWLRRGRITSRAHSSALLFVSTVALLAARLLLGYGSKWALLIEGLASAGLIYALCGARLRAHHFLEYSAIRFLGRTSYSFYLYHPLLLAVVVPAWRLLVPTAPQAPFLSGFAVSVLTVLATIPVAALSYRWIERPMISLGHRL